MEKSGTPENRTRYLLRVLRPLLWWFALVLVLFCIHTHEIWMEKTRLAFKVSLQGQPFDADASFDGKPVMSGQNISLGKHHFTITDPKAEPFSTNLFIWYGGRDFGSIDLKRAKGTLSIQATPPAAYLSINGAEIAAVTLTNCAGYTSGVPTETYRIEAHWANHEETKRAIVGFGTTALVQFDPPLGAMALESTPTGALVVDSNGNEMGTTPLTLRELGAGLWWKGEMRLDGYAPAPLSLKIPLGATNTIHTTLVNYQYAESMRAAKEHFKSGEIDEALAEIAAALKAQPNDSDAKALQARVTVFGRLRRAKAYGKQKNFSQAITDLEAALRIEPENAEAKQLLADFQNTQADLAAENERKREQDRVEKERQDKLNRPKNYFREWTQSRPNNNLFEEQVLVVKGTLGEIRDKLVQNLTNEQPVFAIMTLENPEADTFRLQAKQGLATAGWRRCDLVGVENTPGEVTIVFKIFEYAYVESFSIRAWIGDKDESKMVAIHPSRLDQSRASLLQRRPEGIAIVRKRVLDAAAN